MLVHDSPSRHRRCVLEVGAEPAGRLSCRGRAPSMPGPGSSDGTMKRVNHRLLTIAETTRRVWTRVQAGYKWLTP